MVGLFDSNEAAQTTIRALQATGFSDQAIGVVMRDLGGGRERVDPAAESEAASGAATGAVSGGVLGGVLGLLGSLLLPGVGPIVAGGVLGSTLVGAGAGAATGGVIGASSASGFRPTTRGTSTAVSAKAAFC
ncbi:MAG: general stress protein [Gemmatimonadales bacterium]